MIAVFVARDASTRNAELLRKRHAFMTLRTAIGPHGCRRLLRIAIERHDDVVNAVTVGADRCARDAANDRLAVHALDELVGFAAVAFAARVRDVDFRD